MPRHKKESSKDRIIYPASVYEKISLDDLVVVALGSIMRKGEPATFERMVAECFHLFPGRFSLLGYPEWPNAAIVNKAWLRCRTDKGLLAGTVAEGFRLTDKGRTVEEATLRRLARKPADEEDPSAHVKRGNRQTAEGRVVMRIEQSAAYKKYQKSNVESVTEFDLVDLLFCSMESDPAVLTRNYEALRNAVKIYQREDLLEFLKELKRQYPDRFRKTKKSSGMMSSKFRSIRRNNSGAKA
jgi:hypothetical protein